MLFLSKPEERIKTGTPSAQEIPPAKRSSHLQNAAGWFFGSTT
jgi:hypothetical protein